MKRKLWRSIALVVLSGYILVSPQAIFFAAVLQDFNITGQGTAFAAPGAQLLAGRIDHDTGKFLRLAFAASTPGVNAQNSITFPATDPVSDVVIADFDFRITPGNAVTPGTGRADGFGFTLLDAARFPDESVVPQLPPFVAEEPNFGGSLGIGFDIFKNVGVPNGYPDDIGDDAVRGPNVFSNSISVHYDGSVLEQRDVSEIVDLAGGEWIHARIIIEPEGTVSKLSVILTPRDCEPIAVVDKQTIPGYVPSVSRVHFAARSGGESAHHDLDNIRVQYLERPASFLGFNNIWHTVDVRERFANLTVRRSGNLTSRVRVKFATANLNAIASIHYRALSGTLTFASGESEKMIRIPILPDNVRDADRSFRVSLLEASSPAVIAAHANAIVKIFDPGMAAARGHWNPIQCWPILAVHMHLLPSRQVMFWDRLGNIAIWNPITSESDLVPRAPDNLFCGGHAFLANGQLLVAGGHHAGGDPNHDGIGIADANLYNAITKTWTGLPNMNAGRWYPTNTALGNGEMLVLSGSVDNAFTKNFLPQIWQPRLQSWRDLRTAESQAENAAALGAGLYPRMFLAPSAAVFKAGPDQSTWFLNTAGGGSWRRGPDSHFGLRDYGTAVLYGPGKVMIAGGGDVGDPAVNDATATVEIIDLNAASPGWTSVASMHFARRHHNATLLPDGSVLVTGGTDAPGFNNEAKPVTTAELWRPGSRTWTSLAAARVPRGYHSTALLLPDGRVLTAGGGQGAGATSVHNNAELYVPPYLFKGQRPTITTAPGVINHGQIFPIDTPDAANITQVSLIRLPSVTHAFDQNQRFIRLGFTRNTNGLSVTTPSRNTIAPPGHYMLFVVNNRGVPSVARIVRVAGG